MNVVYDLFFFLADLKFIQLTLVTEIHLWVCLICVSLIGDHVARSATLSLCIWTLLCNTFGAHKPSCASRSLCHTFAMEYLTLFIPITDVLSFIILFIVSMDWCGGDRIGLDLFNDDTCPSGHISRHNRVPVHQQWNVLSCSDSLIWGLDCWEIVVLVSVLIGVFLRTWQLIGCRHKNQPLRGPVAASCIRAGLHGFWYGFLGNLGPWTLIQYKDVVLPV